MKRKVTYWLIDHLPETARGFVLLNVALWLVVGIAGCAVVGTL